MPQPYLIRDLYNGRMATVHASSPRGAMKVYAVQRGVSEGDAFAVKERRERRENPHDDPEWEVFSITKSGIRSHGVATSEDLVSD